MWNSECGMRKKAACGRSMKARPTQSRERGQGKNFPLQGQGGTSSLLVCPLWGLGQRPNCSAGDQHLKGTQQRCRQRSVPASNFARPQTRPKAALPPRFREEPFLRRHRTAGRRLNPTVSCSFCVSRSFFYSTFFIPSFYFLLGCAEKC